ncbi:hypothetical protein DUI87_02341 [Hirundo rustica rustica]|uniref:Retroviral nucleocapsid Gag protein p24 C-terminal domain-containing protein n=1 Tax=Hirundo rustica rustica TaxID=333673 RepID=A0A3M0L800_HIRRU|nr:hypothetical protein DUI87_02341 [Hirundo rustica rustica]
MRPVFDKSKSSHAVGSSSTAWMLPPCQVTVRPRDRSQFWDEVKAKVEGLSAGAGPAMPEVQPVPSRVPASDPVGSTGQDKAGAAASSVGLQAFHVLQGATHNTYQPLAWQALSELCDAVGKYGLGSAEVMQVLHYFNASLLTPFDIRSLARALFPLVEYDFFENKWTQLAVRAVERNRTLGQGDPRRMVNIDMLMGTGNYTRGEGQAGYEPLVQEQCQQTGMAALVQTLQLATPQQPFATIIQGIDEPFLCFAGWLTAAVEKQVSDPAARKLMIQSLAQGNCNAACKRIIETLPGEPSMSDMVGSCAKFLRGGVGDEALQPLLSFFSFESVTSLLEKVQRLLNVKDPTSLVFHLVTFLYIVYSFSRMSHALLNTVGQQIEAREQGDKSVTQAAANPTAIQAAAKPDSKAKTPAVAAVKKGKKHTDKTDRPVDDDSSEGSSMPPDTQSGVKPPDTQSEAEATDDTQSEAEPTEQNRKPNQLAQDRESNQLAHDQEPNQLLQHQEPNQLLQEQEPDQLLQEQEILLSPFP